MIALGIGSWSRRNFVLSATIVMLMVAGCSVLQPTPDSASVIKSFHDAVNTKNVSAAMALVADDAVFGNIQPAGATFTGKAQIQTFIQNMADQSIQIEPINVQASGDNVTYDGNVTHFGNQTAVRHIAVTLQGGKIKAFTNK